MHRWWAALLAVLTACAGPSQYVGQYLAEEPETACYLRDRKCISEFEDLAVGFVVESDGQGGTRVTGDATWEGSIIYSRITGSHLDFYFVKDRQIIDVKVVWISGDLSRPIAFSTQFDHDPASGYVFLGSLAYKVTE